MSDVGHHENMLGQPSAMCASEHKSMNRVDRRGEVDVTFSVGRLGLGLRLDARRYETFWKPKSADAEICLPEPLPIHTHSSLQTPVFGAPESDVMLFA